MKAEKILVISLAVLLLISTAGCGSKQTTKQKKETLKVYSGAGLRKPMEEIAQVFNDKFNVEVNYTYGGSAQTLSQIELTKKGDVYIPGSQHYMNLCKEKDFVKESKDVAYHIPVIAVPKGNPAGITGLEDLAKPKTEVILGDEKACAIGKVAQKLLGQNDLVKAVEKNIVTKDPTVNEVVMHTAMEQGDASIIWEDNVVNADKLEVVRIDKEKNMIKTIPIGALTFSKKEELAQKFVDFVASDTGKKIFEKHGFKRVK